MDHNSLKQDGFAFYLPDGTFYWFLTNTVKGAVTIMRCEDIYIHINGSKEPNVFGKDIFSFQRYIFQRSARKGILPCGYDFGKVTVDAACIFTGDLCAAKIMLDGWKITYPY